MSEKIQGWHVGEVEKKIKAGQNTSDIANYLGIPVMPELTSRWLIDFYQYIADPEKPSYHCFVGDTDYRMYLSSGCYFLCGTRSTKSVVFNLTEGS